MVKKPDSNNARLKRHARVRNKISGTAERPRLNVFRSAKHIYAQLIDDVSRRNAGQLHLRWKKSSKALAETKKRRKRSAWPSPRKHMEKGISEVVFDRSGYIYHGRVKELAEGAREGGLKF